MTSLKIANKTIPIVKGEIDMMTVKQAISIFEKNVPNKRIICINEWNGKYVFVSRDKNISDDESIWDSTCETVDKNTGKFSTMDCFNLDYIENARTIYTANK